MSGIRTSSDTTVSFGMVQLLLAADVLEISNDVFKLSKNTTYFIGLETSGKAKFLFDAYIKNIDTINECKSITANKLRFDEERYQLEAPRQRVIDTLKMCQPGEWLVAYDFIKQIKKMDYHFLRSAVNSVWMRDDYSQYYGMAGWNDFEFYFINVVLMEYLSVLGAVDVVTYNSFDDYGSRSYPVVEYLRVTNLGLFLFGITDEYISGDKTDFLQKLRRTLK